MTAGSWVKKSLRVTFTLANHVSFQATGENTLTIQGLRIIADLRYSGGAVAPTADLRIYGMRQNDMNVLTMLRWKWPSEQRNGVLVEASTPEGIFRQVFKGDIIEAGPDYTQAPDACLHVVANSLFFDQVNPVNPTNPPGPQSVATMLQTYANSLHLEFENSLGAEGDVVLNDPYLPRTLVEQVKTVAEHAGIDVYMDGDTLAAVKKGQPRILETVLMSEDTGMVGYPTIDSVSVHLKTHFMPELLLGRRLKVESAIPQANGDQWRIYNVNHFLESEKPDGAWFSMVSASEFDRPVLTS